VADREAERHKRLRDALRENLKRRKNQSRGRAAPAPTEDEAEKTVENPDDEPPRAT
jgi:hypothetical protein